MNHHNDIADGTECQMNFIQTLVPGFTCSSDVNLSRRSLDKATFSGISWGSSRRRIKLHAILLSSWF